MKHIKQAGVSNIVTALDDVPVGEVWTLPALQHLRSIIEEEGGLSWTIVEVLPVHEAIKSGETNALRKKYIANWKESMKNLAAAGIETICYDFMPVVNWTRTDLDYRNDDDSIALAFDYTAAVAFDAFIMKREGAEEDYTEEQMERSRRYFEGLDSTEREKLRDTILAGLPMSNAFTLDTFRAAVAAYEGLSEDDVRHNLRLFLGEVGPLARELGLFLAIHPDDPPRRLFGLPRIVSTDEDIRKITGFYPSLENGLTLCVGSFVASSANDVLAIAKNHADKINYVHLRNIETYSSDGSFAESGHLRGDVDMVEAIRICLQEQRRRTGAGERGARARLPMQPDHGANMLDDLSKLGLNAGYSGIGRLKGLAEIRGVQTALIKEMARRPREEEEKEDGKRSNGLGGHVDCRKSDRNV